ncbi:MAG: hypothetical protein CL940_08230 [Deltaproteobacteria bacterium]|nr:hypothetical protein [Deltaproteobacteria bacterium]
MRVQRSDGCVNRDPSQDVTKAEQVRTILVTGAAGFIGSSLIARALAEGYRVRGLDVISPWRLEEMGLFDQVEWLEGDVRDAALVAQAMDGAHLVYHLAAIVGVDDYIERPREVLDVNIVGTRNVLEAALERQVPVILASTSEVYGKNARSLSEDEDSVFGPTTNTRWSYALSKATSEAYARSMASEGLIYSVIRYFNVYGPRMDRPGEGRVISKFLGALQREDPLALVDGGQQVRAFCYIDDAVEGTFQLGESLNADASHRGEIVNVGRHEPVTISELAQLMLSLSGKRVGTLNVPGRTFFGDGFEEIEERVPDLKKLESTLGYRAEIGLAEGLTRVLDHWGLLADEEERVTAVEPAWLPAIRPSIPHDHGVMTRIQRLLRSGAVTNDGKNLQALETELSEALGVDDVVVVSSGSEALRLGLYALDLEPGVVVLPAFTYIASASAVVHTGHRPVFCDVDPHTWTLCPQALQRVLEEEREVRAVLSVTAYGVPADHDTLAEIAQEEGAAYIVDNAHGFGTERGSQRVPSPVSFSAWSMHATKVLPAVEGGFITAPDAQLRALLRKLRRHGLEPEDLRQSIPGFNSRLDEVRAAVGRTTLRRSGQALNRRRAIYNRLRNAAAQAKGGVFQVQRIPEMVHANGQNLALRWTGDAPVDEVIRAFARLGVEARRYFWPPLHQIAAFDQDAHLPVTEDLGARILCLPLYTSMTGHEVERVEEAIEQVAATLAGAGG